MSILGTVPGSFPHFGRIANIISESCVLLFLSVVIDLIGFNKGIIIQYSRRPQQ